MKRSFPPKYSGMGPVRLRWGVSSFSLSRTSPFSPSQAPPLKPPAPQQGSRWDLPGAARDGGRGRQGKGDSGAQRREGRGLGDRQRQGVSAASLPALGHLPSMSRGVLRMSRHGRRHKPHSVHKETKVRGGHISLVQGRLVGCEPSLAESCCQPARAQQVQRQHL